jgi:hypothetical protein
MTLDQLNRLRIDLNEARNGYLKSEPKVVDRAKKVYKDADFRYMYGCREYIEALMGDNGMLEQGVFFRK